MTTGRAAVLAAHGEPLSVRELPVPDPAPGAILVRIDVATLCGSDVHIWQGELGASYQVPMPLVLGHEVVGIVDRLGDGAETDVLGQPLAVGDRIVWCNEPCRSCRTCTIDRQLTLCLNRKLVALKDCTQFPYFTGAFAEYGYISAGQDRVRVPDGVRSEWASAGSCALRTVINSVETAGRIDFMDSVVVQGAGPLGLFATALLSLHAPRHLIVVGGPDERLELATRWGATHVVSIDAHPDPEERREIIQELTGGGPSVAFELSGFPGVAAEGLAMMRPYGRYVISGSLGGPPQSIDVSRITTRGLRVLGSMSGEIDAYAKAMEFLDRHQDRFDWDALLGSRYGLDNVTGALEAMQRMDEIKPIFDPAA
jgi:threonine dehydrogenase-like Zn-dependent dehydrogenase